MIQSRDRAEFYRDVRNALSVLEAAVLDCYLEGRSYREMSEQLRCGTKSIDNALQRVKRKIQMLQVAREDLTLC